ncbi:MAG TPA: IPTL-CTERM sorting domain-containing protein [Thermoanaerobaculia bacterium]|nr:IPTL-CTERM sorting domain-containing protein [Thermoanaerobaculia bacterium]
MAPSPWRSAVAGVLLAVLRGQAAWGASIVAGAPGPDGATEEGTDRIGRLSELVSIPVLSPRGLAALALLLACAGLALRHRRRIPAPRRLTRR